MKSSTRVVVVLMLMLLAAERAQASTDINCLFDARSHGMGGTGVAFLDSPGAIPTNPALLDQIGTLSISADLFVIASQPVAPYTIYHIDSTGQRYRNYETIRAESQAAPLPFIGAALRVHDRVVIGLGAYPLIGQGGGADFYPAPDEFPELKAHNEGAAGLVEAALPVSIRLVDNLSLGVSWRVTYLTQKVSTPVPTGNPPTGTLFDRANNTAVNADIDMTGINFAGFQVGLLYKVIPSLRLGLTYRSKVVVDGDGTASTRIGAMPVVLDYRSTFASPHTFRAGLAWSVLEDKLLFAVDVKYLMYAEAWKELESTTVMNGTEKTTVQQTHWKDSIAGYFGAEYTAGEMFAFRAGYIILTSATNPDYAVQLAAPPGIQHLVSAGFGIKAFDNLNLDIAAAYLVLESHIDEATEFNAGVGTYASHAFEGSLSATYHM
jgi:long-chain fatty acid transport protein